MSTWRLALVAGALAFLLATVAPAAANAAGISVTQTLPASVAVNDAGVDGDLLVTNTSDTESLTLCETSEPACSGVDGLTMFPSCKTLSAFGCSSADLGVFTFAPSATGSLGCAGRSFTTSTLGDGSVHFTPDGGALTLLPGGSCRVAFKFSVNRLPFDTSLSPGFQTRQRVIASALSPTEEQVTALGSGTITVKLAAPTVTDADPDSPANDNFPEIKGTVPAGTASVTLYDHGDCTGIGITTSMPANFVFPGITAGVSDDSTTTFSATVTDAQGGVSACSSSTLTYVEDSIAPAKPVVSDTDPDSPAHNLTPSVKGLAEAGSTVKIYTTSACTLGTEAATGNAVNFASPGLPVTVIHDTSTTFYATATDAAGNVSPCSLGRTYVEDSTPPLPPALTGTSPTSPGNDNAPRIKGTAEPGSTVRVYALAGCTGSFVEGIAGPSGSVDIGVTIPDNTTRTFYATATDAVGFTSTCSAGITYVEDSIAPPVASINSTTPRSPSKDNSVRVIGSAVPGTKVQLYTDAACTATIGNRGSAADFAAGIEVTVPDNTTTTFYVRAFDDAENGSPCSTSPVTYVEDSIVPETTINDGPTGDGASPTPTFTFSSTDPGATFECRLDAAGEFVPCTSPYTTPALAPGAHTFEVRSRDAAGNIDATSSVRTFTVGSAATPPPPPPPGTTPPPPPPPAITKRPQPGCLGITGSIFVGTKSNNIRNGGKATDIMFGQSGNDTLRGAGGVDCLYGEDGNDTLVGGIGADRLFGGSGKDRLDGQAGNDQLSGSFGNDRLVGGAGNDRLVAGGGNDNLVDRGGVDRFSGGAGKDRIDARDSKPADRRKPDRILCGKGKDIVLADPKDIVSKDCERSGVKRRSLP